MFNVKTRCKGTFFFDMCKKNIFFCLNCDLFDFMNTMIKKIIVLTVFTRIIVQTIIHLFHSAGRCRWVGLFKAYSLCCLNH